MASPEIQEVVSSALSSLLSECERVSGVAQAAGPAQGLQLLQKAVSRCHTCARTLPDSQHHNDWHSILQGYTHALLDMTFFVENQLVENDFVETWGHDVNSLLRWLGRAEKLFDRLIGGGDDTAEGRQGVAEIALRGGEGATGGDEPLVATSVDDNLSSKSSRKITTLCTSLGDELVECLFWRQGALCYMYCVTVTGTGPDSTNSTDLAKQEIMNTSPDTSLTDDKSVAALATRGIQLLENMLQTRAPPDMGSSEVVDADDTRRLLQERVFSGTHVLALMYTGELCHLVSVRGGSESIRAVGRRCLQLYVSLVSGPLRDQGWDCTKAQQLLQQLKLST